jgi:surfeit locus 1 family protein
MIVSRSRLRSSIVIPVLFALAAIATFLALGSWQVERKAWKENLIKTMRERISAAPIALPARELWPKLDAAQDEFRHVRFSATYVPATGTLVYAGAPLSYGGTPGYWVFALARVGKADQVVVNRGFVPDTRKDVVGDAAPAGEVAILGVMRWPQEGGYFTPKDDPDHNLWFARDHIAWRQARDGEMSRRSTSIWNPRRLPAVSRAPARRRWRCATSTSNTPSRGSVSRRL